MLYDTHNFALPGSCGVLLACRTIDDIHVRLRQAERGLQRGSGAVSTGDMVTIIGDVWAQPQSRVRVG